MNSIRRAKPKVVVGLATDGLRMLVVDDDTYMRLLCSFELAEMDILEASGVEAGFAAALTDAPDVMLIDVHLSDMNMIGNGLDLVKRLRHHASTSRLPIVVVTAGYDESQRIEVVRAGADEYLAKPVDPDQLRSVVGHLLSLGSPTRHARRMQILKDLLWERQALP